MIDGCKACEARAKGRSVTVGGEAIAPRTGRPDLVYITSDRDYARFYASRYWYGDLYTVDPVGRLEPSTEDPFPARCVPLARVVAVFLTPARATPCCAAGSTPTWRAPDEAGLKKDAVGCSSSRRKFPIRR
ncbi:hypothetical protein [Streptomyces sp. CoH27]|uniref:hypothetical protein n=2 Tax=unclassified Streptomyces TaxID=2593676 RepID=UPI001CD560D5|nr:hypothetical protein [Streptomyces sp. CoH27]